MGYRERLTSLLVETVRLHYQNADDIAQRLEQIQNDITKLTSKVNKIERLTAVRAKGGPRENYGEGLVNASPALDLENADSLLIEAADRVVDEGRASTSFIQRRLRVGYSRASRIIEELEQAGIIGPFAGSRSRSTISSSQWEQIRFDWLSSEGGGFSPSPLDRGGVVEDQEA